MGPEATVELMQRIIDLPPVADSADQIRCIADNTPRVRSRIKAMIKGRGKAPDPCMADMGRRFESLQADFRHSDPTCPGRNLMNKGIKVEPCRHWML
jgi:aspartate racemase